MVDLGRIQTNQRKFTQDIFHQNTFNPGLFLGHFQKTQPQKNSRPFFAEKLNMSGFFEASYKKLDANDFNKYTLPKADGIN